MKKIITIGVLFILGIILTFVIMPVQSLQQNNLILIDDVQIVENGKMTTSISIANATNVAGIKINLSYDPTVINITNLTLGDFDDCPHRLELSNAKNGYVWIYIVKYSGLSDNKIVANIELTAVGDVKDISNLEIIILSLKDDAGDAIIDYNTKNGTVTITPSIFDANKNILFSDISFGGNGAKIVNWTWNFYHEDHTLIESISEQHLDYTFPEYGKYYVELEIENECGNKDTTGLICIYTNCPLPEAKFTHTGLSC